MLRGSNSTLLFPVFSQNRPWYLASRPYLSFLMCIKIANAIVRSHAPTADGCAAWQQLFKLRRSTRVVYFLRQVKNILADANKLSTLAPPLQAFLRAKETLHRIQEDVCSHYDNIFSQRSSTVDIGAGIVEDRRKQHELKRKQLGKKVGCPTCHRRGHDSQDYFVTNEAKREEILKRWPEVRDSLMKTVKDCLQHGKLLAPDQAAVVNVALPMYHDVDDAGDVLFAATDGALGGFVTSGFTGVQMPQRSRGCHMVLGNSLLPGTPLLLSYCLQNRSQCLVLRATLDVKEGVTLDMLDISGCKRLSWDTVRGALPNLGRVGRLRMRGGPLVRARSVAATHKLLAELGACTAAASLSLALRHDEGSLRHSVDQYLSAILSTAARDLKIEALDLDLEDEETGTEGAMALAAALTPHEQDMFIWSLCTLNLAGNQLCGVDKYGDGTYDASGIEALADALAFNTSLNTLDLCGNNIGPEGAKALAVALTPNAEGVFNTSLNTLNLRRNNIGPEGAKALAVALTPNVEGVFNTSLNTLTLYNNGIEDEGAKALAVALTPNAAGVFNTSLNTLDVCSNAIIGDAAQQLAEAVLKHPCIKEFSKIMMQDIKDDKVTKLDLSCAGIGVPGALVLSKLLVFNTSLNTLNLKYNEIGPEGAKALAVALTPNEEGVFNTSLNTLDLKLNNIGPEGAKALAVALTPNAEGVFNTSLNTLNLCGNHIGDEGAKALAVALTPNAEGVFNGRSRCAVCGAHPECGGGVQHVVAHTDLRSNNLGDGGKAAMREPLKKHPNAATFALSI
ncbi:hypothetical protein CYMTET_13690 [Cymbomonas tetramitiformis]|uniref:Uncharacterized protein n=1 Tax=Cymbomonas tetramitiformis TaxID=36881 RepID=A0AAE0GHZ0_9CHLO|nr:hypothetical protein CYMTET_13690 [Cymbomonas tetramitiformis]